MDLSDSSDSYILTRYLYIKDEVELSFITALLKKKNLQECYYWAFELYYSGFDIVKLLWKIYFDFYYELNPIMECYMIKKLSSLEDNEKQVQIAIMSVVRNIYRLKSSPNTFILRQYIKGDILPSVVYVESDNKFHKLLQSFEDQHIGDVCYYIKELLDTTDVNDIIKSLNIKSLNQPTTLYRTCPLHYLLAVICRLQAPVSSLNKCNIFVKPNEADIDFIHKVEHEPIPIIHKRGFDIEQTYTTLGFKRYFKIGETIGSFKLARWSLSNNKDKHEDNYKYLDFLKLNWFHWEYYAATGSPLWCERLANYNGTLDHTKQDIVFLNDQSKEEFYNLYAYEFDEQPNEIIMMSHCDLEKSTWQDWYFDVFPSLVDGDVPSAALAFNTEQQWIY